MMTMSFWHYECISRLAPEMGPPAFLRTRPVGVGVQRGRLPGPGEGLHHRLLRSLQ